MMHRMILLIVLVCSTCCFGQSWNAYAYGTDPLTQVDPSGLVIIQPSWYLGFPNWGGADPGFGAFGLLLGSTSDFGTVAEDQGVSSYPATVNLQEDACIGCNDPGTTDMGGNSTQGDLGLGIYFMFGSYGLYPGSWNPALGNGFWVNGQQSPRPYVSQQNADANGWYSTDGPWFRGPDGTACNAAGACYYFSLQGNGTSGGLSGFITGLLTGNFTDGSYNIDTGEMQTIDSVIDHLNDPGNPHPGMGMPFPNFSNVNQERTLAPYSFSENNSYSCFGPPGLTCVP